MKKNIYYLAILHFDDHSAKVVISLAILDDLLGRGYTVEIIESVSVISSKLD